MMAGMPDAWRRMSQPVSAQAMERVARLGMSPRQQGLNRLWSMYACQQYSARRVDFDGRESYDPVIRARILETQGVTEILEYESLFDGETRALTVIVKIDTIYGPAAINEVI